MKSAAFLVLAIAGCWAQTTEDPAPKFPSDNQDPGKAGAFLMLSAVCPGRAAVRSRLDAAPSFGCPTCPGSDFGPLMVKSVVRGHLLSPTSDDAVLSIENCLLQDAKMTYLVSRRGGKWILLGNEFQDASLCHKVRMDDGRDVLVCLEVVYGRMEVVYQVTYHDYKTLDYHALYEVSDGSQWCGLLGLDWGDPTVSEKLVSVYRIFVSGVDFATRQGRPAGLDVIVNRGNMVVKAGDCSDIPTRPSRVHFTWTGAAYERVGPSDK